MIVLDTNVVSELLRPFPNPQVLDFVGHNADDLAVTAITVHEVSYGVGLMPDARRRREISAAFWEFTESLTDVQVLELNEPAARRSGFLRAQRRASGRPIDVSDAHIAGIVLESGHRLATRNTSDFVGLGLDLIDPWSHEP